MSISKKVKIICEEDFAESIWCKSLLGGLIKEQKKRRITYEQVFDADANKNLNAMADAVIEAYDEMIANLVAAHKGELVNITNAYNAEERLNTLRNNFRDAVIEEIDNGGKNYQTSVYYMDILNEFERMGDFMINVSQDLERGFINKQLSLPYKQKNPRNIYKALSLFCFGDSLC